MTTSAASISDGALIATHDLLSHELSAAHATELETRYGNGDLIRTLHALGIGGPFTLKSPWELIDPEGNHLIHAGGYAALPFGEAYPPLLAFVHDYLTQVEVMGLPQQSASTWRAALEANLIALLAQQAPSHQDSQVFFSNSGAEAVEAAIKFARAARPKGKYLINFTHAYHGKTAGALSLTPNEEYQAPFRPLLPDVITLPYGNTEALETHIRRITVDRIAAVIVEPVQGEGGVITPPDDFLPALERWRREFGLIIIADEVQTGLGRTGHLFASLAGGLEPDIITLAKPLGGGLVPLGATLSRKNIAQKALGGFKSKRHSNTFGGGSLAMAVGLRALELIITEDLCTRARTLGEQGLQTLQAIQQDHSDFIMEVRGAGLLLALQMRPVVPEGVNIDLAQQLGSALALRSLHRAGVHACYTLNSSRVVRLTPALNIPQPLFDDMLTRVRQAAQNYPQAWRMLPQLSPSALAQLTQLALK